MTTTLSGTKRCTKCQESRPLSNFHNRRASPDGLNPRCKECAVEDAAAWARRNPERRRANNQAYRARHPERHRRYMRAYSLKRYGMNLEGFDAMLESQAGLCAICKRDHPGGKGQWHIDHDHSCCPLPAQSCGDCVRGLLCSSCNQQLGWLEKNRDAALSYLGRAS